MQINSRLHREHHGHDDNRSLDNKVSASETPVRVMVRWKAK